MRPFLGVMAACSAGIMFLFAFVHLIPKPPLGPLVYNVGRIPMAQNRIPVPTPRPSPRYRSKKTCSIVTDGTLDTYVHELAHCNGWDHAEIIKHDIWVPPEFIHAYYGPIVITVAGGADTATTRAYAQLDATIKTSTKSATELCRARGSHIPYANGVSGCAPLYPPYWTKKKG